MERVTPSSQRVSYGTHESDYAHSYMLARPSPHQADLQSTCFFLGPAKSWFDALHTIFLVVDPITSFLNAVALSATFPDIARRVVRFSRSRVMPLASCRYTGVRSTQKDVGY